MELKLKKEEKFFREFQLKSITAFENTDAK